MINTVAIDLGRIDIVERQLDVVVHVKTTLRLPDQAKVGVVHHYMDVGQLELSANRQLFDHELEVVIAGERDNYGVGIGGAHPERSRQSPAQRSGLTGVDPVARAVHMQELAAGDL